VANANKLQDLAGGNGVVRGIYREIQTV
jgi:hypothetical protein